jgi:hypothetical protein
MPRNVDGSVLFAWAAVQVAEVFKLDEQGKAASVEVYYDLVC